MVGLPTTSSVVCRLDVRTEVAAPAAYDSGAAAFGELGIGTCGSAGRSGHARVRTDSKWVQGAPGSTAVTVTDAGPPIGHRIAPICSDPPVKTAVLCHWCLASFDTPPVGMPTRRMADGRFAVSGVFCSLECAAAHNFDANHASHIAHTRHALCCEMASIANRVDVPVQIRPAPPRAMLETFGGPLSIDEFRDRDRAYTIVYPLPVVAQVHHAEEMTFPKSITGSRCARFVPIDEDAIDSFTRGLRRPTVGTRGFKSALEYMAGASASKVASEPAAAPSAAFSTAGRTSGTKGPE